MPMPSDTRLSGRRLDLVVAAALLAVSLIPGFARLADGHFPWYGWLLLAAGPLAFLFWRRHPRTVMFLSVAAVGVAAHLEPGPLTWIPAFVAIALSMYSGYRRLTILTVVVLSCFVTWGNWQHAQFQITADMIQRSLLVIGWLHVALISGESRRQRDAYMAEAEHTREEAVKRKAADERVRIARELHDSLTHSISVIRVQAGVALHLARKRGETPPPALVAVEAAAKDATRELRETLTMLRDDDGHRLSRITDLANRYRGLGFDIDVECALAADETAALDEEVDHAAYRIVQEALTNAVRHSTGDRINVHLHRRGDALRVEITDNGTPARAVPGRGLTGMRERVDALGGTLHIGPADHAPDLAADHGFTVRAELPAPEPRLPAQPAAPQRTA